MKTWRVAGDGDAARVPWPGGRHRRARLLRLQGRVRQRQRAIAAAGPGRLDLRRRRRRACAVAVCAALRSRRRRRCWRLRACMAIMGYQQLHMNKSDLPYHAASQTERKTWIIEAPSLSARDMPGARRASLLSLRMDPAALGADC